MYWQRYGQLAPGARVSGLEEEFDLSGGLPRLLYVKAPAPDREPRLAELLARIKEESRRPTGISALPPSWAGWCVMTWRCCSASGSPPRAARPRRGAVAGGRPRPSPAAGEHDVAAGAGPGHR